MILDPKLTAQALHAIAADNPLTDDLLSAIRMHPNVYLELQDWAAHWYGMPNQAPPPPSPPNPEPPTTKINWINRKPTGTNTPEEPASNTRPQRSRKRRKALATISIAAVATVLIALTWATKEATGQNQQSSPPPPSPQSETNRQSGSPEPGTPIRSGNASHTCQTTGTGVTCWGYLDDGTNQAATPIPELENQPISQLAVGKQFTTAITTQGNVYWWTPTTTPEQIGTVPTPTTAITAGNDHACTIADTQVWCYGQNHVGQIRGVPTEETMPPTRIADITGAETIGTTGYDTWATTPQGTWVWGNNKFGQSNPEDAAETIPPTFIPN